MKQLREYFDSVVNKIFDRLDAIESKLDGYTKHVIDGREMIDNEDVCKLLKVSKRSLYRYRRTGELPYRKFSGKLYDDIEDKKKPHPLPVANRDRLYYRQGLNCIG